MSIPSLFGEEPAPVPTDASGTAADLPPNQSRTSGGQTQSLYRKYRPQTFGSDDLVGQEHIVRTLRNAVVLDRVAHAYLFCGPRGTGKTTTARLLAKAVNCLDPDPTARPCNRCDACLAIANGSATDVIEIDAASNRGIDDIRDLRERVKYAPTQLRTKFYIIDEAHQITGAAANAFLKTLEEPPGHTKFVLATTDPEELLSTIVSRCQRFDFRRITLEASISRLKTVAKAEGLNVEDEAFPVIARYAAGSLRDALGLLDQLSVYGDRSSETVPVIDAAAVRALLGVSRNDRVELLATALADRDVTIALGTVNQAVEAGEDPRQLNRQLVSYLRLLLHQRAGGSPDADETAVALAERFELSRIAELARIFSEVDYKIRHSSYAHLPFEVALVEGILRQERGQQERSQPQPQPAQVATRPPVNVPREDDIPARQPSTSLKDKVRGKSAPESAAQVPDRAALSIQEVDSPEAVFSDAPLNAAPAESQPESTSGQGVSVEQLIDLWSQIRLDVKAVNRRVEALLASMDPVAVRGDEIVLAAAYPFHRDRMNTDDVRIVVDEAISHRVNRRVHTVCILKGDELTPGKMASVNASAAKTNRPGTISINNPKSPTETYSNGANPEDDDQRRVKAAKYIFNGEEVLK